MNLEFPYQLATFLENEPALGEPVYYGTNNWYPQIALKRRFNAIGITEDELIEKISDYCITRKAFEVKTGMLIKSERMPIKVLEVAPSPELIDFHNDFISFMGSDILSRYPERDGENYLPHVTAEFNGEMVIDSNKYAKKSYHINQVFLLKDIKDENSVVYKRFILED